MRRLHSESVSQAANSSQQHIVHATLARAEVVVAEATLILMHDVGGR
jgi:hypothetical protein